ncbi:MAG TPA: hypothetical protein PLF18_04650 [Anaerolineales bacterium]|nr:hypothetical protein [Anaerolineales bacterium]
MNDLKDKPSFFSNARLHITALVIILATLLLYYIDVFRTAGPTTFDDAYMFIRYADNFIHGYGFAWNPDGVQTYGATSILYLGLVIIARIIFQGLGSGKLLVALSAGLGLPAIVLTAYTVSRYAESKLLKSSFLWLTVLLVGYLVTAPVYLFHMKSGMDSTLSFLCNALLIFSTLGWVYNENRYRLFSTLTVIAGYLAFLARPDNLLYTFFFPVLAILFLAPEGRRKRLVHFLGWLGVLLALDTLVKFIVFSDPLPLPFYAKSSGFYEGYIGTHTWNPIEYLFAFGTLALPFLVLIVLSSTKQTLKLLAVFLLPIALTFTYYFTVVQIMGFEARYYFPALPYLIVLSILMLDRSLSSGDTEGESHGKRLMRVLILLLIVALFSNSTLKTITSDAYKNSQIAATKVYSPHTEYTTPAAKELPERGTWPMVLAVAKFSKSLPEGIIFAQSEYGFTGAESPHLYIVDIIGLHDSYFAHNGFSVDEFLRRKPDLIWFPHFDYTKITAEIIDSQTFWEQYEFYPGAFDFGLAIRKDSLNYQAIHKAIEPVWREVYETRQMEDYLATPTSK